MMHVWASELALRICCCCFLLVTRTWLISADSTDGTTEEPSTTLSETTQWTAKTTADPVQPAGTITKTTTPPPSAGAHVLEPSDRCSCDLTRNACDVNCCCDSECSNEDSMSFASCVDQAEDVPDLRYCTKRDIIFANRTIFEKRPVGDLLCIVVDNVMRKNVYAEPPLVSTVAEAHRLIAGKGAGWEHQDGGRQPRHASFKAGDVLLLVAGDGSVREWRLPTQLFSVHCEATESVRYLRDQTFKCRRRIGDLRKSCTSDPAFSAESYHSGFSVSSGVESRVKIQALICSGNDCVAPGLSSHVPFVTDEGSCANAVSKVTFRIVHAGARGIANITAYYDFETVPSGAASFMQEFATSYIWESSGTVSAFRVSGNPGYLTGHPIPAECFKGNGSLCNGNTRKWISAPATRDGICSHLVPREKIKFLYNLRTGCLLSTSEFKSCTTLQRVVYNYLVSSEDFSLTHVATFGNSNRSRIEEHARILSENVPKVPDVHASEVGNVCSLPATRVIVSILYAKTETSSSPQKRIVSLLRHYGESTEVKLSLPVRLELAFSATFVDVSTRAVDVFAPPPTLEARLPYDFFYPFFLDSGCTRHSCPTLMPVAAALLLFMFPASASCQLNGIS